MFQLITSPSTRLNQVFIFFTLKLYPSLETLPISLRAGGTFESGLITAVSSLGTALASCGLLLPEDAIWNTGDPLDSQGHQAPCSMGLLRVCRCHTEHQGHVASDPRVTMWLSKFRIQEAGPSRGREPAAQHLEVSGRGKEDQRGRSNGPRAPTEFMQLSHRGFTCPWSLPRPPCPQSLTQHYEW